MAFLSLPYHALNVPVVISVDISTLCLITMVLLRFYWISSGLV
jgi:hypothetical protein